MNNSISLKLENPSSQKLVAWLFNTNRLQVIGFDILSRIELFSLFNVTHVSAKFTYLLFFARHASLNSIVTYSISWMCVALFFFSMSSILLFDLILASTWVKSFNKFIIVSQHQFLETALSLLLFKWLIFSRHWFLNNAVLNSKFSWNGSPLKIKPLTNFFCHYNHILKHYFSH